MATTVVLVMGIFSVALADHAPPTLAAIADQSVVADETLVVPVSVTPPTGVSLDDIEVEVTGLPAFGDFSEAEMEITFEPGLTDNGNYGPITVTATVVGAAPTFVGAETNFDTGVNLTDLIIDRPPATQEGDLMVAQVRYRGNITRALTVPPGWEEVATIPGTSQANHAVYWKIAGASEPASYTFTQTLDPGNPDAEPPIDPEGAGRMAGGIGTFRGVDGSEPIQAFETSAPTTGTLDAPSLATTHNDTLVLRLWGWRSADTTDVSLPGGVTLAWSEQTGHASQTDRNQVLAGYHVPPSPGVVGVSTAAASGPTNNENALTVALNPAIPGGVDTETFNLTVTGGSTSSSSSTTTSSTSSTTSTSTSTTTTTTTVPTPPPPPPPPPPDGTDHFTDDDGHVFEADINAVATAGFTRGCNPPVNDMFCPEDLVTRGQMAAFLVRALNLTDPGPGDLFDDDNGSVFEGDIDRLATAGITRGCNPPTNNNFCPDDPLTRGQMAAFLVRALGYSDPGPGDLFTDDDGHVFEADIDRLATAGVTRGCNPPTNDRFCPDDNLTRGQMAAFLARALIYGG